MHVAAAAPRWISREEVPDDLVDGERKIFEEQAREDGKPDEIIPKIVEGKLEAFYKETCLLDQPWIRDDAKTIGDLVAETSAKVGEKIQVGRFARYRVGEAEDG
jgi:elongation factor Ts